MTVEPRRGRTDWATTIEEVLARRPNMARPAYRDLLTEERLAAVLRDVVRVDQSPVQRGVRMTPDLDEGRGLVAAAVGDEEFTILPFGQAFTNLIRHRRLSITGLARKLAVSRTQAHRLVHGEVAPGFDDLGRIAQAFGKPATYFREYRSLAIAAAVAESMERNPERSALLCNHLPRG